MPERRIPAALLVLLGGTFVSTLGDGVATLSLVLEAASTGPSWWVTEVYFAELVPPLVLAPFLGALVDRVNAKHAWLTAVLVQGVFFAAAALLPVFHARVILVALANVFAVISSSAGFKLLPSIAGTAGVGKANSWLTAVMSLSSLAGPGLGGLLFTAFGNTWLLAFNAVSFVIVSFVIQGVVPGGRDQRVSLSTGLFAGALDGLRAMWRSPVVRPLLPILAAVIFATSIEGVAGVFYLRQVTSSDVLYGFLLSAWSLGSLPGSLIGAWRRVSSYPLTMVLGGAALMGAALLAEGLVPVAAVIAVAFVLGGFGNGAHNVGVRNVIHHHIPPDMHGRAWAYFRVLVNTCVALGYLLGTPGVVLDARSSILASGSLTLLATVYAVWRLGRTGILRGGGAPAAEPGSADRFRAVSPRRAGRRR
ncbi:MFS transporter [Streptosporangium sp. NPDC004379]|uniref:MFS transporter n=1 Tax=Streptosporangium sp. NPDC004379 TaxID=3366189 RepID=UPI0036A7CD1E